MDTATPSGFQAGRHKLGLTQQQLGAVLGVGERAVQQWEHRGPARWASRVLAWMLTPGRPGVWPDAR